LYGFGVCGLALLAYPIFCCHFGFNPESAYTIQIADTFGKDYRKIGSLFLFVCIFKK